MSEITSEAIYDKIPYPNLCHNQTHPDRMATIGRLLGMEPASLTDCRVLELACAKGGNLVPLGLALPGSEFVGLDYSAVQVAGAVELAEGSGINNVTFLRRDLTESTADLGTFDYIVAHGIYSWTPEPVRQRILTLCREQLRPNGIAFISFNALPGWAMLRTMREMMLYQTRNIESPGERSIVAREFVRQLAEMLPDDQYFGFYVQHYAKELERRWPHDGVDPLFLHDELEIENNQFYFHEFVSHLENAGLQYLSEAELNKNMLQDFSAERARQIVSMADGDFVAQEQLMDIVRNRTLRQALVVHKEIQVERRLSINLEMMAKMFVALRGELVPAGGTAPAGAYALTGSSGARLATDHPVSLAAFSIALEQSPYSFPFDKLVEQAREIVGPEGCNPDPTIDSQIFAGNLLRGYTYDENMIMLGSFAPPLGMGAEAHPVGSPVARWQAARGYEVVASIRHQRVRLEPIAARVLPLLDGSRSRTDLVTYLHGLVESGELTMNVADQPLAEMLAAEVDQTIEWLARAGLIMGQDDPFS